MAKHLDGVEKKESERRHVGSRVDRTLNANTASTLCQGDLRLRNIRKTLNNLGILRSSDQVLLKFELCLLMFI